MLGAAFRLASWALLVPLVGGLTLGAFLFQREPSSDLGYWRQVVLDRAVDQAVYDLPASGAKASIMVLPFLADPDGQVEGALSRRLEQVGRFDIVQPSSLDRLLVRGSGSPGKLDELEKRAAQASRVGADFLLLGQVLRFEQTGSSGAELGLQLRVFDVEEAERVWDHVYQERLVPSLWSPTYIGAYAGSMHWFLRTFLWMGFVAILPVVLLKPIRRLLAKETNAARLGLWISLSTGDVLMALLLVGQGEVDFFRGLMLCVAALACVAYNLYVLSQVARVMR